ncbi:hypothetical protein PanWU01x14_131830 [Parasponia andersonii]|uniref:Uncharacterized protein n=1 Tax=Parasponia andersonii TaxID=3476 RepID=A0A2P5CQH6_PARAD|nr:hypothetical protein PanWU01x14_131830 [Parasponia andersonii]
MGRELLTRVVSGTMKQSALLVGLDCLVVRGEKLEAEGKKETEKDSVGREPCGHSQVGSVSF